MVRHGPHGRGPRPHVLDVIRRASGFRCNRRRAARQGDQRLVADDRRPLGRLEATDEGHVLFRPACSIPRDPDTVRMPQLGLAVVTGKLLGGERVFSIRPGVAGIAASLLERVHDQRAVDPQRRVAVGTEEHQSAAEAPGRRTIGTLEQGLAPNGHHFGRLLRLVVGQRKPPRRVPPLQLRAADGGRQADKPQQEA